MGLLKQTYTVFYLKCDNCFKTSQQESTAWGAYEHAYLHGWDCHPNKKIALCSDKCKAEWKRKLDNLPSNLEVKL
jgi:hypothetical protein